MLKLFFIFVLMIITYKTSGNTIEKNNRIYLEKSSIQNEPKDEEIKETIQREKSVLLMSGKQANTSDDIHQRDIDILFRNHRRDISYPYDGEKASAFDWGVNTHYTKGSNATLEYEGNRIGGLVGYKFSPRNYAEIKLGFHAVKNITTGSDSHFITADLKDDFILSDLISGTLSFKHDYIYQEMMLPGGISDFLYADTLIENIFFSWAEKWKSQMRLSQKFISDGNKRLEYDFATMYGISISELWIWAGFGVNQLGYQETVPAYYSPLSVTALGPRLDMSIPLFWNLSFLAGGSLNEFYDADAQTWGTGYYAAAALQYGNRNDANYTIFMNQTLSEQHASPWTSFEFGVQLNFPF